MGLFLNIYFKHQLEPMIILFINIRLPTMYQELLVVMNKTDPEPLPSWNPHSTEGRAGGRHVETVKRTDCEMTRAVKKTQWGQARARSHAVQLLGTHLERLWDCSPGASTAGDGRTAPRLAEMMCSFCVKSAPQLESSRGNFHFKTVLTKIS